MICAHPYQLFALPHLLPIILYQLLAHSQPEFDIVVEPPTRDSSNESKPAVAGSTYTDSQS